MSNDAMREAFERAYEKAAIEAGDESTPFARDEDGDYLNEYAQVAWWGYQAALAAPAQSDRAAIMEEAAVLLCEVSQKYNNLEIIDALQEVAGVIRTRLSRGSLAIAVEYAKRQSSTSAQSVEPVARDKVSDAEILKAWGDRDRSIPEYKNALALFRAGESAGTPPSAEGARDAVLEEAAVEIEARFKGFKHAPWSAQVIRALKSKKEA